MTGKRLRRTPWGLIGAVAAVLTAEAVVARLDLDLTRPECYDWRLGRRAAAGKARGCDVLCFGTSMVTEGVFPEVIERRTGLRAYNLAVCGGRTPFSYYYLRRALAAGARPSAVVTDFHPAFIASPIAPGAAWPDALGYADSLDIAWTLRDAHFFAVTAAAKALPSVYNRHQIRHAVLATLRGEPFSMRTVNVHHIRNMKRNKGSLIGLRNPNYHGEVSDVYRGYFLGDSWRCDPNEEKYIHKFLGLAAAHGIRVYWLVMPLAPALQHGREVKGRDADYARFVRSFAERYPNLVVVDGRHAGYDHTVFLDACHLDPQGAFVFSSDLSEILRRGRSEPPRAAGEVAWVDLPAYRDRPIDVPLEDIRQTELVLQRAAAVRK